MAPPPPITLRLDVSYWSSSGWASSSRVIVGTPLKLVTRSRSIARSASPASHLYISTSLPPLAVIACAEQLFAVTWNSGVVIRVQACGRGSSDTGLGTPASWRARSCTAAQKPMLIRLLVQLRWVSRAPLGWPVVPDVKNRHASASGSTSTSGRSPPPSSSENGRTPGGFAQRTATAIANRQQALQPLAVAQRDPGRRVVQCVRHLVGRPPGVHTDRDRPDRNARPVEQHPFRVVAHRDGDAVTRLDTLRHEPRADRGHVAVRARIAPALVLVDEVVGVGVCPRREPDVAERRWRGCERAQAHAADVDLADLEGRARARELVPGLVQLGVHRAGVYRQTTRSGAGGDTTAV